MELIDVRTLVPARLEQAITTPHGHEHPEHNKPLWLIWKRYHANDGVPGFPELDSVCDTEDSCRYHVGAIVKDTKGYEVFVERIPANHRFGSSLPEWQVDTHRGINRWRQRGQT